MNEKPEGLTIAGQDPVVWTLEFLPGISFQVTKKPKLWTRFGIWLWFGLKGKDIEK